MTGQSRLGDILQRINIKEWNETSFAQYIGDASCKLSGHVTVHRVKFLVRHEAVICLAKGGYIRVVSTDVAKALRE